MPDHPLGVLELRPHLFAVPNERLVGHQIDHALEILLGTDGQLESNPIKKHSTHARKERKKCKVEQRFKRFLKSLGKVGTNPPQLGLWGGSFCWRTQRNIFKFLKKFFCIQICKLLAKNVQNQK